jgi:predicted nuclease with TOPRIM domain
MTTDPNIVLNELHDKIERLIELYTASREKGRSLEAEVSRLQQQARESRGEIKRLSEEVKGLKVAAAFATGEGNREARARIGQLAREVDKCITLLNG